MPAVSEARRSSPEKYPGSLTLFPSPLSCPHQPPSHSPGWAPRGTGSQWLEGKGWHFPNSSGGWGMGVGRAAAPSCSSPWLSWGYYPPGSPHPHPPPLPVIVGLTLEPSSCFLSPSYSRLTLEELPVFPRRHIREMRLSDPGSSSKEGSRSHSLQEAVGGSAYSVTGTERYMPGSEAALRRHS